MLIQDVQAALAPCRLVTGRNTLSPIYRALELGPDLVRAFSSYAAVEIPISLGIDQTVIVDGTPFLAVVASLQADADLSLRVVDNALVWACGAAEGRLALMAADLPAQMGALDLALPSFTPTQAFIERLALGALSCDTSAFGTEGMVGIVIEGGVDGISVSSTDNHSISSCFIPYNVGMAQLTNCNAIPSVTLPPEGVNLLTSIIAPKDVDGQIHIERDAWVYDGMIVPVAVSVKYAAPLTGTNIPDTIRMYSNAEVVAALPLTRIDAFIKRTIALTEDRRSAVVGLSVQGGRIKLAFIEGLSTTEEFFLIDGLDVPDLPQIMLSATKMAKALSNVTEVVLDYVERGVLILYNPKTAFTYMLSGTTTKGVLS